MTDRQFSHPNFGNETRVEWSGREVRLTFVAGTTAQAEDLALSILDQLKQGALNITLMGKPTKMERMR